MTGEVYFYGERMFVSYIVEDNAHWQVVAEAKRRIEYELIDEIKDKIKDREKERLMNNPDYVTENHKDLLEMAGIMKRISDRSSKILKRLF